MCGIVGKLDLLPRYSVREANIRQMLAMVRHRGPDQFGIYCDGRAGLGSARLSIIDLSGGADKQDALHCLAVHSKRPLGLEGPGTHTGGPERIVHASQAEGHADAGIDCERSARMQEKGVSKVVAVDIEEAMRMRDEQLVA